MRRGLSLANKCQLLFGGAILLIVVVALVVPWVLASALVDRSQFEASRQIARLYAQSPLIDPDLGSILMPPDAVDESLDRDLKIVFHRYGEWTETEFGEGFEAAAKARLTPSEEGVEPEDEHFAVLSGEGVRIYRYARLLTGEGGAPRGVLVVTRRSAEAAGLLFVTRVYMLFAGLAAGLLALLVFYFITTRIILSPVRSLRDTAELVREGNLHIRADLTTGDEFEELSDTFNAMLEALAAQQEQLRVVNKSLDLRLNELAERNVALYEAARLKGEFLASVSHELRTPLNSIIGFAEILQDIANAEGDHPEAPAPPEQLAKRRRYLNNIASAGRSLLEMINELLTMAKIEAGKVELHVQETNIAEVCEALLALIRPLAERKNIELHADLTSRGAIPLVRTDPQKLQQIVFNFLSNAIKFTPEGGRVTLRAERVLGAEAKARLRISVIDTGPGIPRDQQEAIFEKFRQLDSGHTRRHQGTGLGLAIAREFADMLGCEIQVDSEVGQGSMFSLLVPLRFEQTPKRPDAREQARDEADLATST